MNPPDSFPLRTAALIVALVSLLAANLRAASRDVLACATDKAVFVVQVNSTGQSASDTADPQSATHSSVYGRILDGDGHFTKLITLSGRITALAGQSDAAIVLLDSGQWMTIWPTENPLGPAIADARILTIAGGDSIWAIASPTTAPSAIATTAPSTNVSTEPVASAVPLPTAAKPVLRLFHLSGTQWVSVCELPTGVDSPSADDLSLVVSGGVPTLGVAGFGGVRTWTWANNRWTEGAVARPGHFASNFRLLECGSPAIVWLSEADGTQWLSRDGKDQQLPPDGADANASRSAACVAESVRVFSQNELPAPGRSTDPKLSPPEQKVYEQVYSMKGAPIGTRAELPVSQRAVATDLEGWISTLLTVIVAILLVSSAWRRPVTTTSEQITAAVGAPLAPQGTRLLAGAIDLLPVWLAMAIEVLFVNLPTTIGEVPTLTQLLPFYIGVVVYLAVTASGELIAGRSIGKWMCGLRVAQLDGKPLTPSVVLIRNVLRVVDIFLMWIPLAMILISPLRQRLGDVIAGTVVVRDVAMIGPEPLVSETSTETSPTAVAPPEPPPSVDP